MSRPIDVGLAVALEEHSLDTAVLEQLRTRLRDQYELGVPQTLRRWVMSFPFPLRYLFAAHPQAMGKVLGFIYRAISTHLVQQAGFRLKDASTGAVTLIQRFGSALDLNIHFSHAFPGRRLCVSR